ncbi:MAG TPA: hypothetical protein DEB06_01380 [Phycisphaerales bacterium]|nr:hypothetical protein [Phycisphaerales bacterium]
MNHSSLLVFSCAAALALVGSANAGLIASFQLADHPDGNINPPPYGVRFDDIFNVAPFNQPGNATFSFDAFDNVVLSVFEDAPNDYRITIAGTVFGGVDAGGSYGFGAGAYSLFFEYEANVSPSGTGWIVTNEDPLNDGTITSLGNPDVPNGTVFTLEDEFGNPPGFSFAFLQDEHRLAGHPQANQGYWVGRGWFEGHGGITRDFLFIGKVPTPGAGTALLLGLGFVTGRRRR